MNQYIGTKIVHAEPQRGPSPNMVDGSTPGMDGYKVVYADGYKSWSPKDVFEEAYRSTDGMTFGLAIEAMKKGKKVCRRGWNGKGMFLAIVSDWNFTNGICDNYENAPFIGMKTADDKFVPWLASQTDMLSEDWMIVD